MNKPNVVEMQVLTEVPKKIHPVRIPGNHQTNYDLGRAIIGMRYDQVCEVLRGMFDALSEEIARDMNLGHTQLVKQLSTAWMYLGLMRVYLQKALQVCRPYMKHELGQGKDE